MTSGTDAKRQGSISYNNAYAMCLLQEDTELARITTETILNLELSKFNERVDLSKCPYTPGRRDYTWSNTGITKQLDHVLDDVIVLSMEGEALRKVRVDLEIESSFTPKDAPRMANYARTASIPVSTTEDGFEVRVAPLQVIVALRSRRQQDKDVIGYDVTDYRGNLVERYRCPIFYLSEAMKGTIFEPYYVAEQCIRQHDSKTREEWKHAFYDSLYSVASGIPNDSMLKEALEYLMNGLNQRSQLKDAVSVGFADFIRKETDVVMETVQRGLVREAFYEKAARERKEYAEEVSKERLKEAAINMINLGCNMDLITKTFGDQIWTPDLMAHFDYVQEHGAPSGAQPAMRRMDLGGTGRKA